MARIFRPRGIEKDGLKYYQERNGDFLSIDPSTNDYYIRTIGKDHFEGRATAIAQCVGSVCTTGISREFLQRRCKRVSKATIPQQWLDIL
jgi:hypothetical protein